MNQRWAMDFVQDAISDGRTLLILTTEDTWSREALACVVDTSISGLRVRRELTRRVKERGERPQAIRVDNGAEMIGRAADPAGEAVAERAYRIVQWPAAG